MIRMKIKKDTEKNGLMKYYFYDDFGDLKECS